MKKKDRQRMLEKYMKCAAWGSAGILLTCFIRGHVIKENGTVRELKISFLEKEKEVIADCAVGNIMTALTYTSEKDHVGGPAEDVTQTVMKLFPIGTYLSAEKEDTIAEDSQTYAMILEKQANDENAVDENGKLITQEQSVTQQEMVKIPETKVDISMDKLRDYEYLMSHFYTVDSSTMADANLINADRLLGKNMKLNSNSNEEAAGPKVLIYHTHSQEQFKDSVPGDANTSIVGMGTYLTDLLNQKYGIETYHHTGVYDLVNGKLDRSKAYQLAEPDVQKILKDNPSIEVVIDLHRDGVAEGTHLVTEVDGRQTAQIMFFNGLSRTRANGNISYLPNPYLEDNLAFSLQMEIAAAKYYPGFARHIFLRAYRYNMHFKPKTLLVEAGAQTNTVEEMRNAMELLAELLHQVLS